MTAVMDVDDESHLSGLHIVTEDTHSFFSQILHLDQ